MFLSLLCLNVVLNVPNFTAATKEKHRVFPGIKPVTVAHNLTQHGHIGRQYYVLCSEVKACVLDFIFILYSIVA